jgi:peroxiredoxin
MLATAMATGALALSATVTAEPPAGKPAAKPDAAAQPKDGEKHKADKPKADHKAAAKIGETAPDFTLTDTDGKTHHLADHRGKIVVLEWFNPDCPVIVDVHQSRNFFNPLVESYKGKDVVFLAINSGAEGKQGAGKDRNAKAIKEFKLPYPILLDADGKVGRSYGAKTTPHVFIIAADGSLAYAGGIDNGNPSKAGDTNYVKQAIDELLAGKKVTTTESRPYGCSVKY